MGHNPLLNTLPPDLVFNTLLIPLGITQHEDELSWPHEKYVTYTVRSWYVVVAETRDINNTMEPSLWMNIWNLQVPQKIKQFMWKFAHNAFPMKSNLYKITTNADLIYPICAQA